MRVPAIREALTAVRYLGPRLMALEIGNEPDAYGITGVRRRSWNYTAFSRERDHYRTALAAAGLRTPLWGPSDSGTGWLGVTVADREDPYAVITQHFYPLSRCRPPTPTVRALLSDATLAEERSEAALLALAASRARRPLVMDETNSVSCYGGQPG